jgi:hypothetical protein
MLVDPLRWAVQQLPQHMVVVLHVQVALALGAAATTSSTPAPAQHFPPPGPLLPAHPRFHLSFARFVNSSVNDPNGVQFYGGKWHYFFQHRYGSWDTRPGPIPHTAERGMVGFAHAISADLLRWSLVNVSVWPEAGTYDAAGAWSGGGFSAAAGVAGLTYRARPGPGVAVAVASDPALATWSKLGILFPGAIGDALPIWRTLDGRWHGGGAVDDTAKQHGHTVTYSAPPSSAAAPPRACRACASIDGIIPQSSAWVRDRSYLLDVAAQAANWPGSSGQCPDFFPAHPPGTASPLPSTAKIWAAKFSSYIAPACNISGRPSHCMTDTPDYFMLGEYDQERNRFAPEEAAAAMMSGGHHPHHPQAAARLFPADFGHFFASQTFWDPEGSRRLLAGWVVNRNNTQGMLREITVVPDEDDVAAGHSLRFRPIDEVTSLRVNATARTVRLLPDADTGGAVGSAPVNGFEQMDVVATFSAPVGGWENFSSRSAAPCSFGVRLRQGGGSTAMVDHVSVAVHNHCERSPVACGRDMARARPRLDAVFENGAGQGQGGSSRAATLTLDTGSKPPAVGGFATIDGDVQLLGGPFALPTGAAALELRLLVDHALVEAFAGGRASASGFAPSHADAYDPTATGVVLFSSCGGTAALRGAHLSLWEMGNASVHL